ncbi:O-fucosyltransferase 10-like protein [Tanacetum coccineum]
MLTNMLKSTFFLLLTSYLFNDLNEFGDIYDEEHFIDTLKEYVDVVRELPKDVMEDYDFNISNIPNFRVPAWASATYYLEEVYPVLREHRSTYPLGHYDDLSRFHAHHLSGFHARQPGIIRFAPFANRLASSLPPHIQYLRCLANYEALRFSIPIMTLGKTLVKRMTIGSSGSGGKYVSVHLRFEEDMVAFSCCVYDGGKSEQLELDSIRQKGWGDKFKRKGYVIDHVRNRIDGRCPMTPLEVGMMLRGMGFSNTTPIYLASGKIYHADKNLAPLRKMFPLLRTKEFLASPNELASFQGYSSRLAALDYIVCLSSEVFVTTQGGNFPHFLMGHRKFHYRHAKTIIPDKRKLAVLLHNTTISWQIFKNEMQLMLEESDHKGIAIPKFKKSTRKNSIYANPFPECRCLQESNFSREE